VSEIAKADLVEMTDVPIDRGGVRILESPHSSQKLIQSHLSTHLSNSRPFWLNEDVVKVSALSSSAQPGQNRDCLTRMAGRRLAIRTAKLAHLPFWDGHGQQAAAITFLPDFLLSSGLESDSFGRT
jgi:hypothetical protein